MKTRIYSIISAIATSVALPTTAAAQSLDESVTVEGKYSPEIINADRLPLLPSLTTLTPPESRLEYDQKGVYANFLPDALPMVSTGWRTTKKYDNSKGYIDLRLGSWLNSSLTAGVAAVDSPDTKLGITLQHNSTSLWQAWSNRQGLPDADKRFRYDERLNAALAHRFGNTGTLKADVQYHLGYFNYYGTTIASDEQGHLKAPTQTINDAYAGVIWTGNASKALTYGVKANARHFAYRAFYSPSANHPGTLEYGKGERETEVNVGGMIDYSLAKTSGLEAEVLYTGVINTIADNVNRLRIKPAYTLQKNNLNLRLGMDLAVVGADRTRLRIAPDVKMTANTGIVAITAAITGGTNLRTLAWMHNMNYYSNPLAGCTGTAYSPIDACVGVQLNPAGKWTFGLEGSWQTTLDESLGGFYQEYLNSSTRLKKSVPNRLHGISVAINAGYDLCKEFKIHGKASWQPQHGTTGVLNGFDRPRYTADITAGSQPIEQLRLELNYHLRACRELVKGNISRLNLTADYKVTDRISVGAELNNLLNRHENILPGLALEGFNAAGGVQILF